MNGIHNIVIYNNRIKYEFEIRRNITIISGDSATGKSTLINMIRSYYNNGKDSGIKLKCDKECKVIGGKDWYTDIANTNDSIIFIDEGNRFVESVEFARAVKGSDNYFVIATRNSLHDIPYSVSEIYKVEKSNIQADIHRTYNRLDMLYGENINNSGVIPQIVITEDSNSGYDFFVEVSKQYELECESANGKSNIKNIIDDSINNDLRTVIIADGAAFGNEMQQVMKLLKQHNNYSLYLPESFEWIILKSGVINDNAINDILENPSNYIDSKEYMSWERFFTEILKEKAENIPGNISYSKSRLNSFFKQRSIVDKILHTMEKIKLNKK